MKDLLRKAGLVLIAALLLSTAAAAEPTVYTASGTGYGGELTVEVTMEDGVITDIALGESHETNVVIDRAFPVIRERILEANSPVVDSVSAATFSSYAVKAAVADAMKQAGMDVEEITMATAGEEKPATEREDENCDIVIVGGGPAGLAAAVSAKQTNPDVHVILVEKLDILSGNGKFDMNFFDIINTQAQKEAGNEEWTVDQVAHFIEAKSQSGESAERIAVWAEEENTLDAWLRAMGVELNYNYGGTNHMAEADQYAGEVIQAGLENAVAELGVDVRTGTKGTDLVMEDGTCKGVLVTNNDQETYTIYADSVIVATGGFCCNKELLAEYAPGYEVLNTSNQMGATGDFVKVFEKYGFKMENMGKMSVFANIIVPRRDLTGGADMNLLVNREGELLPNQSGLDRGLMIMEQTDGAAFYITDQTGYDSFYRIRKHVGLGYYAQGETLEELAEALGIDAAGLTASVEQYNADAQEGTENASTGSVPSRALDAEGPYYGVRVEAANHMTKGGVVANEHAQVLTEEGNVVPGLYAAGEVTWQSGGYSQSVVFGKIAGAHAAAAEE
ncbi:MAG TPA: FAD-binding protein [Candidatus Ventricola intestinavium]|nr:FAD-binding protein [Candidatus Ventricola intestinavium]